MQNVLFFNHQTYNCIIKAILKTYKKSNNNEYTPTIQIHTFTIQINLSNVILIYR